MQTAPRNGVPIDLLILHDPEGANTAQELSNYLDSIAAGYHWLADDNELIVKASDDLIVYGAGGVNSRSLHGCVVPGRAAWSRDEWLVHRPAIERLGKKFGEKCKEHGIPPRYLTPQEVAVPGTKGICRHWDVSLAGYSASDGHTDPGPNFPLDVFMAAVQSIAAPPVPKEPEDVICVPQPNKAPDSHGNLPHAEFMPPSELFPRGAALLRCGADVHHSVKTGNTRYWDPPAIHPGRKWVSMFLSADRKRLVLRDSAGATTRGELGLWR
jgi:hypothetical protein